MHLQTPLNHLFFLNIVAVYAKSFSIQYNIVADAHTTYIERLRHLICFFLNKIFCCCYSLLLFFGFSFFIEPFRILFQSQNAHLHFFYNF